MRFALALLLAATFAGAQTFTASITGTVTDPAGAVVPHAHITATDVSRNVSRSTDSDDAGRYLVIDLQPGSYTLTIEAAGFKKHNQSAFELQIAQKVSIDAVLQVGAITDSVTVTAEPALLEATSSSVGKVVEN